MRFLGSDLTPDAFLAEFWQQRPLFIEGAFPGFEPELDADDIAGLACDELAESRLVTGSFPDGGWTLRHGPFSEQDFATLPERDWTLLVQDVEKHYPPLRRLLDHFDCLPAWRIDDLMVSVAGPGGSVGPHVDQYDVFLLQAAGRRRWQIAEAFDPEWRPDCDLRVLQRFEPEREWTLEPGDVLYLPPGVAHHGVALEPGMTWSIGMRAPSAADLLQSLGEWLAENSSEGGRYRDPDLRPAPRRGEVDAAAVSGLRALARAATDDPREFALFLGAFLSRYRLAHEPAPPPTQVTSRELARALQDGAQLAHHPWTRLLWIEDRGKAILFAAGAAFECGIEAAETLCNEAALREAGPRLAAGPSDLVIDLLNRGHLILEPL
jgi:50S ribosomal protein L16 3-hydroxylase